VAERLARTVYSLLLRLATPLYFVRLWWRGQAEPLYREHLAERLGLFAGDAVPGRLWLHAVSLGETHAAAALLGALRAARPGIAILLTHGTATGRNAGRALLRPGDAQAWLPYDTPGAVQRFLRTHRPAAGVVLETEVWPNLLRAAQRSGVPMVLASARLSLRSAAKGRRLRALLHPALARFTGVLAQTEADAARLLDAGAQHVQVMGNLKFDVTPNPAQLQAGRRWRQRIGRPVVLAASTREGEEGPLLRAWADLPQPQPLLLLVPRHPQRFDEVATGIAAAGFVPARRSDWRSEPSDLALAADVWLGDSLGEMALYCACADAALLGGSFAPLGGQNLIEAAACGCPVVMGPHTFNFAQAAALAEAAGAAERVTDLPTGVRLSAAWANDDDAVRAARRERAQTFAADHRGAAVRMAAAVLALCPTDPPAPPSVRSAG
jgi:3-deoxy-D-manno-octulosonic-acid transferase